MLLDSNNWYNCTQRKKENSPGIVVSTLIFTNLIKFSERNGVNVTAGQLILEYFMPKDYQLLY